MNELERKALLDCPNEQPIKVLESRLCEDMHKKQPLSIVPYLIGKYLGCDGPLGDLSKDCVEDGAIGPYIKDGLEPEEFFTYIANNCCDDCFKNALEPLRKEYNEIVGPASPWRLIKIRGEKSYEYAWFIDFIKSSNNDDVETYYRKWLAPYDKRNI